MRIAICLYGKFTGKNLREQNQGFEIPYKFLKKNVLNESTDIFIHGWDDNLEQTKKMLELIRPKKYIVEKQKKFNIKNLNKLFPFHPKNKQWNLKKYIFNIYSRFYSLKKVVSLVDRSYDIILVARFDCVFYKKINFNLFNSKNFYVSHWRPLHEDWGFHDCWFISGNKNIKNLSLIFNNLNKYYKPKSNFIKFIKKKILENVNYSSAHAIWRYRIEELKLKEKVYAYGLEYLTWGLLRNFNKRYNPWGRPSVDVNRPVKLNNKMIHKKYINVEIINRILYKIF